VIRGATAGMKEVDASQTAVLNDLFSPISSKRAKDLGYGEEDLARYVGRLSRVVEASGALDKIATGRLSVFQVEQFIQKLTAWQVASSTMPPYENTTRHSQDI
jgi:hypothetical protein